MPTSSTAPSTDVSQGPRNGLRQNPGRVGPDGGPSRNSPSRRARGKLFATATGRADEPVLGAEDA
ncbi:hypothetical protein [Streptomyces sp. NBC_01237]|uniref:hypothetical protein n=1 Tax=Streptomyces sp. NBC_01237 TaxID=2903790 RepID=UPI002DDB3755|nr:hypothetical protein [Streptomyces sp. NBC_01237]WRZ78447.1 hypothetical protein OG251_39470 [Streptomyces sp. NBC_01237]